MSKKLFDSENIIFRFMAMWGYVWWLHILWLICCLPVFTIGASTTALCYGCMKLRRQEGYVTCNFFSSFIKNFKQATCLFAICAVVGVVLLTDIRVGMRMNNFMGNLIKTGASLLLIPYGITVLYIFAVQARFVNPVRRTIQYAFVLGSKHMKSTIKLALAVMALLLLNQTIVLVNFLTLSMGMGVLVYFMAGVWNKVFEPYIP